jgi:hypothetical protein
VVVGLTDVGSFNVMLGSEVGCALIVSFDDMQSKK